jgi:hypothetical protein
MRMPVTPYVCVAVKNSFGGAAEKAVYLLSGAGNGCVFTESVSGIESRGRKAPKERSAMLGPNLNERILPAAWERNWLWDCRNRRIDKSQD